MRAWGRVKRMRAIPAGPREPGSGLLVKKDQHPNFMDRAIDLRPANCTVRRDETPHSPLRIVPTSMRGV